MNATIVLRDLMRAIDEQRGTGLAEFLHGDFRRDYAHTGEAFDARAWIRLNAEYPGFQGLVVEEIVGDAFKAASRSLVTGTAPTGEASSFSCATFVELRDGLIWRMTEVWTDVNQVASGDARPSTPGD